MALPRFRKSIGLFPPINVNCLWRLIAKNRAITPFDINIFLRQLATLITAGIPIINSFDLLERSQSKKRMRLLIYTIRRDLLTGRSLYHGFKHHPNHFDALTCQMVKIGEHTGQLDTILKSIANEQERTIAMKSKFQQAFFYPTIIVIFGFITSIGLFLFVIPKFCDLFQGTQTHLPMLTRCIFRLATWLQHSIVMIMILLFVSSLVLLCLNKPLRIGMRFKQGVQRLPLLKLLIHKIALVRFNRNLGLTFAAGIPITTALQLLDNDCHNPTWSQTLRALYRKINGGERLYQAMESSADFPPLMIHMIKIGEESGMLELMLLKVADFFESDINRLITTLSQALEPLIMIVLGVLIGGLMVAIYLPIFKLGSAF